MKRFVTVHLGEFSLKALAAEVGAPPKDVSTQLMRAVRLYLGDRGANRPGWPYPAFLRDGAAGGVELELEVDETLWSELEEEAARQEVSAPRLAEHAALYCAAEMDAGRIAQRILDDIEDDGEDEKR